MRMRHCGVIPFRSGITRGSLHPRNRESRKKTCIYFAFSSLLDFLRLAVIRLTFFFSFGPRCFPAPHLRFLFRPQFSHVLFLCLSLPLSLFLPIHWFYSMSFCGICDPMLHADSVVASRRATFILLPLRKLSWCASPGASERNVTFWKPLSGVVCRKLCVISNAHAAFGLS